ncbi:hypothetical protein [Streptomyces sp. NBC_00151]|uniref:hypothetical protein n=1 Tax=Streptomyces sp. NBC_00151 TaxID=2975669 RepID=UPI002DDB1CAF|nr:hypothetical protein [Streptomyces sp. NBC_00151]WRZ36675.1 hypothetical protein OG915_00295 [Streptomyces sp. NBC_00151]
MGVDAGAFERSWGKLAEGERLERALQEARRLVGGGVPAPLSLDGNEPFDRVSPEEQLVRRVALHLYRGETDAARHVLAAAQPGTAVSPAGLGEEHATTSLLPMEDSSGVGVGAGDTRMGAGGRAGVRRGLPGGAGRGGAAGAGAVAVPGGGQSSPARGFYEATARTVRAGWAGVRERVVGGDRIVVTVDGRPGLALVPLSDLGADPTQLPTIGVVQLRDGLGGVSGRVKDGERLVVTDRWRRIFGVVSVGVLQAAHPGAVRVPLPLPGRSAGGSGTEEITANELWADLAGVVRRVAEDGARYLVTRSGKRSLGVVSETDFNAYLSHGQPQPTHRTANYAARHPGEIYAGLAGVERYLVTHGSFRAVLVSAEDLGHVSSMEPSASLPEGAGQSSTARGFYEATAATVKAGWRGVRERVVGGDRIVVTVDGWPGLALVPLSDLGADPTQLPTISTDPLLRGLGAAAGRVGNGGRLVVTDNRRLVLGVVSVGVLQAAHPEALARVPLPPPGRSAGGSGTEEIAASALWANLAGMVRRVAEDGARYLVTRSGTPVLGVVSETDFNAYLSHGQPQPTHRTANYATNHPGEFYERVGRRSERYLVTHGSFRAVFVSVADLKSVSEREADWASLVSPASVNVGAVTGASTGVGGWGVVPGGAAGVGAGAAGGGGGLFGSGPGGSSSVRPGSAAPGVRDLVGSEYLFDAWSGAGVVWGFRVGRRWRVRRGSSRDRTRRHRSG